jgi:hypothetical protein
MKTSVLFAAFVAAALVGCGSAGTNDLDAGFGTPPTDAGTQGPVDAGNNKPDAGQPDAGQPDAGQPDAGEPDAGEPEVTCSVDSADFGALNTLDGELQSAEGVILLDMPLTDDADLLSIQIYEGFGAMSGGIQTGTFTLGGDDLNFETCGLCVLLYANSQAEDGTFQTYMATGGTVTLTSVDGRFTGSVSDLTFEHVTVDEDTFHTTAVGDGCVSAITSGSFDKEIPAAP